MVEFEGIILGAVYCDKVSGFEGTCTSYVLNLNGMSHFGLQPKTEDKSKLPDIFSFDRNSLEFVNDGLKDIAVASPICHISLGDKVKDTVTNFTGIATTRTIFLNGCIRFGVDAPDVNGAKEERYRFLDVGRLAVVKATQVPHTPKTTGGPNLKAERY